MQPPHVAGAGSAVSWTCVPSGAAAPAVRSVPSEVFNLVVVVDSDLGSYSCSKREGHAKPGVVDDLANVVGPTIVRAPGAREIGARYVPGRIVIAVTRRVPKRALDEVQRVEGMDLGVLVVCVVESFSLVTVLARPVFRVYVIEV